MAEATPGDAYVWRASAEAPSGWTARQRSLGLNLGEPRVRDDGRIDVWLFPRGLVRLSWPELEEEATYLRTGDQSGSWTETAGVVVWSPELEREAGSRRFGYAQGRFCDDTLCDVRRIENVPDSPFRGAPRARGGIVVLGDLYFGETFVYRVRDDALQRVEGLPSGRFSPPALTDHHAYTIHDFDTRSDGNERFIRYPYPAGFAPSTD